MVEVVDSKNTISLPIKAVFNPAWMEEASNISRSTIYCESLVPYKRGYPFHGAAYALWNQIPYPLAPSPAGEGEERKLGDTPKPPAPT